MKKSLYIFGLMIVLVSCSNSEDDLLQNVTNSFEDSNKSILSFDSKDELNLALNEFEQNGRINTRSTIGFVSADDVYENGIHNREDIGFLVPDSRLRNFLNEDLDIIVSDTMYHVSKNGTFYAPICHKEELENSYDKTAEFRRVSSKEKVYGNIRLYDTFNLWESKVPTPIIEEEYFDEDLEENSEEYHPVKKKTSSDTGEITQEDVDNFPEVGAVNVSVVDKIIRFSPDYYKSTKIRFKSDSNRKLYVSLYRYDYVFGVSIGIDCKVMKKLWHGLSWGHVVNWDAGIYYGISSLIVKQNIKDPVYKELMKNRQMFESQWQNAQKYGEYLRASQNYDAGIKNIWETTYNPNKQQNKYNIPCVSAIDEFFGSNSRSNLVAKKLDRFLVDKGISFLKSLGNTNKQGQQLIMFSDKEKAVYSYFRNDLMWNGGGYKIHKEFMSYYKDVILGFSIHGGKTGFNIDISENQIIGAPKIYSCEGLVYTKDGDGWIGAKIVQKPSE
jgi:hypothetical protein